MADQSLTHRGNPKAAQGNDSLFTNKNSLMFNNQKRHETNKSHDFHKTRHEELGENQNDDSDRGVPGQAQNVGLTRKLIQS